MNPSLLCKVISNPDPLPIDPGLELTLQGSSHPPIQVVQHL